MVKIKNKFIRTIRSTLLCIKYPFLYPRNRWTDKHYNNWKIHNKLKELYSQAYETRGKEYGFKPKVVNYSKMLEYKILKFWHDYPLQWIHFPTWYTEWDAMDKGWKLCFGEYLLEDLKKAILVDGGRKYLYSVRVMQIKEKWGRLEIYLNRYGDKTFETIQRYSELSEHVCIDCGKLAVGYTTLKSGWITPYCEDCKNKLEETDKIKWLKKNGVDWFYYFSDKEEED